MTIHRAGPVYSLVLSNTPAFYTDRQQQQLYTTEALLLTTFGHEDSTFGKIYECLKFTTDLHNLREIRPPQTHTDAIVVVLIVKVKVTFPIRWKVSNFFGYGTVCDSLPRNFFQKCKTEWWLRLDNNSHIPVHSQKLAVIFNIYYCWPSVFFKYLNEKIIPVTVGPKSGDRFILDGALHVQ